MDSGQPAAGARSAQEELDDFLDGLTRLGGVASAAEALVVAATSSDDQPEKPIYRRAAGFRVGGEPLPTGCRFDAASLTKPWMATLATVLDQLGMLSLESRLGEIFDPASFEREARTREVTLAELLRHQSGIEAWAPLGLKLGKRLADREELTTFLLSESLCWRRDEGDSPEVRPVYSDLGYILWGLAAEQVTGRPLAALLDESVCAPLGVAPLGALAAAPAKLLDPVECRLDNGKEVELAAGLGLKLSLQRSFHLGVPQDGNARALRFLTAHAGLFVTADEILTLAREWLRPSRLLTVGSRDNALAGDGAYALGWARWSADGSSGPALSARSFGHTGFTGGSLWIDPEGSRIHILLAHRLSSRIDFNPVRREFHRLAAALPVAV